MLNTRLVTKLLKRGMGFNREPAERINCLGSSIWVEFNNLAIECNAVNLGQGFPDSPAPKFLTENLKTIAEHHEIAQNHQYTRGFGHPQLVSILSTMYSNFYGTKINANDEILVTVGAYLALYYTFLGWINKGDEVLIIEPAYDCYVPQVRLAGGIPIPIVLEIPKNATRSSEFSIDFEDMEKKISEKTKMLVINNPNNPTGKLFTREELEKIAGIAKKYNLIVVADEVYEFHVCQGKQMVRFASLPGMYERTISIGSAGKAFSVTGWKIGWAIGPKRLLGPLRAIHQNCAFTCSTPTQKAVAEAFEQDWPKYLNNPSESHLATGLSKELKGKQEKLLELLKNTVLRPIIPDAGYFMLVDFSKMKGANDFSGQQDPADFVFTRWLCKEKKLAVIPPSAFYSNREDKIKNQNFIRLCFLKKDETLEAAGEIVKTL